MDRFIYVLLFFLCLNACVSKDSNSTDGDETKQKQNSISLQTDAPVISEAEKLKSFRDAIVKIEITELPFSIGERYLQTMATAPESDEISYVFKVAGNNPETKSNAVNSYFYLSEVSEDSLLTDLLQDFQSKQIPLKLVKRLPPESNIERLIYTTSYELTGMVFWSLITFDLKAEKMIDQSLLAVFAGNSDTEYKSGLYINENSEVKSVIMSYYDSPGMLTERKLKVEGSGQISKISEETFDLGIDEKMRDFNGDYNISLSRKITTIIDADLISKVPQVELPFSSDELAQFYKVATPAQEENSVTRLLPEALKEVPAVANPTGKPDRREAFNLVNPQEGIYERGDYFYPIFRFQRNDQIQVIAYLYQSFCNYHPTIYLMLCSYDQKWNPMDSLIISRNFFSGELKFTDRVSFDPDFTVHVNQTIQNFEGLVNGTSKEIPERLLKKSYQISETGKIIK
ncbi:MAG: hypothetical protein AAFQ94_08025 [Bacteroidota bacterium]